MGSRDRIAGVAEVNSVGPDRGGGLRCCHRHAPSVFAGARATSLLGWQALSLRRCCAGDATHSDGCSIRAPDECVANLTCPRETGPLRAGKVYISRLGRAEKLDEEVAVQRAADCVCAAAGRGGHADRQGLPQGRDQRGVVLQLAQKVWRPGAVGDEAAEAARGGEPAAEEAGGRSVARQGDAAGRHPPKNMRPARKRQLVDEVRSVWQVSIRRACQALPVDRSTYHYRCKRTGQAILMKRINEIAETRVR